jgi:hypothetical protein
MYMLFSPYLRLPGHRKLSDLAVAGLRAVDLEDYHRLLNRRREVVSVHGCAGWRLPGSMATTPAHEVAAFRLTDLDPLHVLGVQRCGWDEPNVTILASADQCDQELKRQYTCALKETETFQNRSGFTY